MTKLNERIKALRVGMHLSQEYVAKYLGVSRSTYTQIENGHRKVLAEEAAKLGTLFGISTDDLIKGEAAARPASIFAQSFEALDARDQEEIMALIRFKEMAKKQRQHNS